MTLRDDLIEAMAREIAKDCGPKKRRKRPKSCAEQDCDCLLSGRASLTALSRVLAARGLKVTTREATEDSADMGLSVLDVHMAATAHYPIELPEMVWRAMHDAAPDLLGGGS